MKKSRRQFLAAGVVGAVAVGVAPFLLRARTKARFTGGIVGANSALGHALRDGKIPAPTEQAKADIVIVGGGIAGLAAARQLQRNGYNDFLLLELEAQPGGNALSGANSVSAFPWGAHYVPVAGNDSREIVQLFAELGIVTGYNAAGLPIYREDYLCADPMERLYLHGRWQEGLVPQLGNSTTEQGVLDAFFAEMQRLKSARGRDGRRAFAIPLDESSQDESFTRLDRMTMADYLREQGWFDCKPLRWYVNYCCRDDYGAGIEQVSAWAGVHYFASRDAQTANAPGYAIVTWPQGNGWLVERMRTPLTSQLRSSCLVWNVVSDGAGFAVDYFDANRKCSVRVLTRGVIWAAPRFVAQRVVQSLRSQPAPPSITYSPWMVANLTLDALPEGGGAPLAWDNVIYDHDSLGYVVATHQNLHPFPKQTVITWYQPLDIQDPVSTRQSAVNRSYQDWAQQILAGLKIAHPRIESHVSQLDIWLWGHAMVRPVPGFIWGGAREQLFQSRGNLFFAHSDASGISIFEEAYIRGVRSADALLRRLHESVSTS